jgi:hypothetical protein
VAGQKNGLKKSWRAKKYLFFEFLSNWVTGILFKEDPRAIQYTSAGQKWPAGLALATPEVAEGLELKDLKEL